MTRKIIFYTGRVQGVGFRYTVATIAQRYAVAGYVQNLDDGRVRLEAQGQADQVDGLIEEVGRSLVRYIRAQDLSSYPADASLGEPGACDAFTVRY